MNNEDWCRKRYDMIPEHLLHGTILEVGARYPERLLNSIHREAFLKASAEGRYTGIDLVLPENNMFNVKQINLFEMEGQFDTILALEFIEHIDIRTWPDMFAKFKSLLKPNGFLYLSTPHKEDATHTVWYVDRHLKNDPPNVHVVYGIIPELISRWLQGAHYIYLWRTCFPKDEGETWRWAIAREIKRVLTRHPYAWQWVPRKHGLIILWQKGTNE